MIRDAFDWIAELTRKTTDIKEIDGAKYTAEKLYRIGDAPNAKSFTVTSLTGVIDYLNKQDDYKNKMFLHVESPSKVVLFTGLDKDAERGYLVHAAAIKPEFSYEHYYDIEEMLIKLQAGFIPTEHSALITRVLGNVTENEVTSWSDNGFSQGVTTKQSLINEEQIEVPSRVILQPFRTFLEVDQPASEFVIRLRKSNHGGKPQVALFEADGGAWRVEAINNVRKYLQDEMVDNVIPDVFVLA